MPDRCGDDSEAATAFCSQFGLDVDLLSICDLLSDYDGMNSLLAIEIAFEVESRTGRVVDIRSVLGSKLAELLTAWTDPVPS